jgi:Ankyrin repeat
LYSDAVLQDKTVAQLFGDLTPPGMVLQDGSTPLYAAAQGGHLKVVTKLLAARANVDAKETVSPPWQWTHQDGSMPYIIAFWLFVCVPA